MRFRLPGLVLSAVVLFGVISPAVHAASGATCAASAGVTLSPGISQKPTAGTFTSVRGGTLACFGVVNGTGVAGKGSLSFSGRYGPGDTCERGKGSGTISAGLPKTGGGKLSVKGTFKFTRIGSNVIVQGKLAGTNLAGNLQFFPKVGQNCFKTKVTRATVTGPALSLG